MSSTRRVADGERRRQNGWASAPEFDVLRPINGTAVTHKAALQFPGQRRELIYALQALSLREGGLKRIADEVIEMFSDRIGTPAMIALACKPGKRLTPEQRIRIDRELSANRYNFYEETPSREWLEKHTSDYFYKICVERARMGATLPGQPFHSPDRDIISLHQFIEELCVNPHMEVAMPDNCDSEYGSTVSETESPAHQRKAELPYFDNILGTLVEYVRRMEQRASADYVETSIGKIIFEALDYAMETRKPVLIEGKSGFGKSTAVRHGRKCI
jgi:hypothetical protein